jgi:hypothetical protein
MALTDRQPRLMLVAVVILRPCCCKKYKPCPVNVLLTGNQRHDQLRVLVYDPVPAWTDPPA